MIDFNSISLPDYSAQELDKITEELTASVGNIIPIDVDLIVEKMGIELIPSPGLKYFLSTDGFYSPVKNQISYDPDVFPPRIRFSIAHELGHSILHSDIMKEIRFGSEQNWKDFVQSMPGWFWAKVEKQANTFASKLLVPKKVLVGVIPDYRDQLELATKHVNNDIETIIEYLSIPLSKRFEVSEGVIKYRFINEGLNPLKCL